VQIFTQSMSEGLFEHLMTSYEAVKQENKETALCIFAFTSELYGLADSYIQPAVLQRFLSLLSKNLDELSRPSFFPEAISLEYFNIITTLITRSPSIFASDFGSDFLMTFAATQNSNHTLFKPTSETHRVLKRMLLSFKQRDSFDMSKRSVFYSLILKSLIAISKIDEFKAYKILRVTILDAA